MTTIGVRDLSRLNVGFIGGGNMAYAIAAGLLSKGVVQPNQLIVSATSLENLRKRWNPLGVDRFTTDNVAILQQADIIFLCVKPHILPVCRRSIESSGTKLPDCQQKVMVSILAGVTLERLNNEFSCLNISIVRSMPNTPMQVGQGCTIYCAKFDTNCDKIVRERYEDIQFMLDQLGLAFEVKEEQMNGITGLTGCGPAYVYEIIEGLADGGVKQGIPREMAMKMAAQTVMGAAKTVVLLFMEYTNWKKAR
ncbi:pyrroline-5-carboxylate reductase 1, mitochondrial isoform X2 [Sabethes cyaneus]|uniref:pyrroline-5-carboxylate reductase 1, mitochondrial isoform X2 n=1 Tax=Sabethes cyaneus TaxID=53552 RepID=UPI00237DF997|nr:pyrroline-5-carboxylate reductase 1, mitochondrial isoform X2 [Sabethes cyaneus]